MTGSPDDDARVRLRAFVRAHHPDVGGDHEAFVAGLAELRARRDAADRKPALSRPERGEPRNRPPDRYDAPVVVVADPRGLGGVLRRVRAWRLRKRRSRVR
ncbi:MULTISPECIES: hypothetical protein [Saccharopolyspora]|uniref:J domain-containing protein n=1 Tax=Saccharopolyspora gregorii TaxID=33914 RepID=A0ABP6RVH7_9PSEU|nr:MULTISPECIES: hypothetical protein [Saccharopolyspora]MCA1186135.1 hypothetical protein [Saccharopolyspora sp. 6T]MCA1193104.1 hypothetical protein [Saccharopolyspora sp. 6V]MCA1224591.1 hypothetical protein [Saccharopolyspora sp. 6M]MCA1279062.1 hypothetical protein [Saccharopolyspora sp. 7B]